MNNLNNKYKNSIEWILNVITFQYLQKLSLRFRLTILFGSIFGAATIAFNFIFMDYSMSALKRDFDNALYNYCIDLSGPIVETINRGQVPSTLFPLDLQKVLPFSLGTTTVLLRNRVGEVLSIYGKLDNYKLPFASEIQKLDSGSDAVFKTINDFPISDEAEADTFRLITFPVENKNPKYFLQVLAPRTLLETQIENRLIILRFGIPLAMILAMILGYFFAGRSLNPLQLIIHKTRAIKATDLTQRVPIGQAHDELHELAITINQMLERLEKSFNSQEKFIADASHQLLSPLTILRSSVETAKQNPAFQQLSFISDWEEELKHLTRIVQDMLLLAQLDSDLQSNAFQPFNTEDILIKAIERLQKEAEKKIINLSFNIKDNDFNSPNHIGIAGLLEQLFFNLIENAIKYSNKNSRIDIVLEWSQDYSLVKIKDQGPGIDESIIPIIFERFSRAPAVSQTHGFGLGLAIVKKIADLHGISVSCENIKPHGCLFLVQIKKV